VKGVRMVNDRLCEQKHRTHVILSGAAQSAAESKNLRIIVVLSSVLVRRSFDSPSATLRVAQDDRCGGSWHDKLSFIVETI